MPAAIDIDDEEIGDARAVPDKRDALAVGRPDGIGRMLNLDQLLDSKLRLVGGSSSLRTRVECQRGDGDGGSKATIPIPHRSSPKTVLKEVLNPEQR